MVRPKSLIQTEQKTFMFFSQDIETAKTLVASPKEIFNLGIKAIQEGWNPAAERRDVEDLKERVRTISVMMQNYIDKTNLMAEFIQKQNPEFQFKPEVVKTKELKEKLEELEKHQKVVT